MIFQKKYSKDKIMTPTTLVLLACLASILTMVFTHGNTDAADLRNFNAANIMSDAVMSNKNSMTEAQIQSFLRSKNPCNNTNIHMASWYPHVSYNIKDGKFVCMAEESFNGESAAHIIWQAGQDYDINPQVIIVLLQKEQGLITDTWPNSVQYRSATGFGCPDTAACDSQYYGFKNQVRRAAEMFRSVLNGGWTNYPVGPNYIQYNPNAGCGGTWVNIQNRTTSALYRYTPYQPNQSALNAGYGTGDGCGAYGNRNFWLYFTDWFGSTQSGGTFTKLDAPRWMQLEEDTYKTKIFTGETFGTLLEEGKQIYFPDKYFLGNQWYLRTNWDKSRNNADGILLSKLGEIPTTSIPRQWMSTNSYTTKIDPVRVKSHELVSNMTAIEVVDSITVDGKVYYRTAYEKSKNRPRFIRSERLESFRFYNFTSPRILYTIRDTQKVNVQTGQTIQNVSKGSYYFFNKRITIDGELYAQVEADNGTNYAVPFSDLGEIQSLPFVSLDRPRTMKLSMDTQKKQLPLGEHFGPILAEGREIYFPDKIQVNGVWYLRTQWDKDNGNYAGIPLDELSEM